MIRSFSNFTRTIYPRVNILITDSKNVKRSFSYPIARGDWNTNLKSMSIASDLKHSIFYKSGRFSSIFLDSNTREVYIYSDDFYNKYKYYIDLNGVIRPRITTMMDINSDSLTYFKIY